MVDILHGKSPNGESFPDFSVSGIIGGLRCDLYSLDAFKCVDLYIDAGDGSGLRGTDQTPLSRLGYSYACLGPAACRETNTDASGSCTLGPVRQSSFKSTSSESAFPVLLKVSRTEYMLTPSSPGDTVLGNPVSVTLPYLMNLRFVHRSHQIRMTDQNSDGFS